MASHVYQRWKSADWPFCGWPHRPPLGVARMTKGVGLGSSKTTGRFSRMVYAERYLNTTSLQRKFPNFGLGRPTHSTEHRKKRYETTADAERPKPMRRTTTNQQRGETKPPHTPRRTNAERKQTPNAKEKKTTPNANQH